jgi:succinate dehydrogenase / fumarate reductase membrane anchor subunit
LSIFILLVCIHAFIGLWTVGTDYLTQRTLGFISNGLSKKADIIRKLYEVSFLLLGLLLLSFIFQLFGFRRYDKL